MTWDDVRQGWREGEEDVWRPFYESRGFADWWAWRENYVRALDLDKRAWEIVSVADPLAAVPGWYLGGFKGWRTYVPESLEFPTFADAVKHPLLRENKKVTDLVGALRPTRLIGLRSGGDIVVVDGTHRAAAIALMAHEGGHAVPPIEIAVADVEPAVFDQFRRARISLPPKSSTQDG